MSASVMTLGVLLQLHDRLTGPLKGVQSRLEALHKQAAKLTKIGTGLAAVGFATSGLSQQAQGFLGDMTRSLVSLDDVSAKILSMPGQTDASVKRMVAAGRLWSQSHADTAEDFVNASYVMLGANLNEQQALAGTRAALAVAKATMGDAVATSDALALSYNNFGNKALDANKEIGRMGDVLTKTQQVFQIKDMQQLSEGLSYATSKALTARVPFEVLNATIGQLNSSGLQGAMAGTSFSALLRQLPSASTKMNFKIVHDKAGNLDLLATLEQIKRRFKDIKNLTTKEQVGINNIFGDEGGRPLVLLLQRMDDYKAAIAAVNDNLGATAEGQKRMESGAGQQMKIALNNWEEFKRILGTDIVPLLKDMLPKLRDILMQMSGFGQAHPGIMKAVLAFTALSAVLAPVFSLVGGLLVALGATLTFWPALAAGATALAAAIGAPIVAIGLMTAAIVLLWKNWDGVVDGFKTGLANIKSWFGGIVDFMGGAPMFPMPAGAPGAAGTPALGAPVGLPALGKPLALVPSKSRAGENQKIDTGGVLNIKIDSAAPVKVSAIKTNDPRMNYNVDAGLSMAGAR